MKELKEILREIANSGIKEECIIILENERLELIEFIDKYGKTYISKLYVKEVRRNDLIMQYEIVVKEKKDECK